jgi:hypothetical protein
MLPDIQHSPHHSNQLPHDMHKLANQITKHSRYATNICTDGQKGQTTTMLLEHHTKAHAKPFYHLREHLKIPNLTAGRWQPLPWQQQTILSQP